MTTPRALFVFIAGLVTSACPGGTESRVCNEYFEAAEQCAAKSPPLKAEGLRGLVNLAKEGLARNNEHKRAVEDSCRSMLETLRTDPECK